jgi:hypothetical protein
MDRKPLVLKSGQVQQLQSIDDLDIPLTSRVDSLEYKLRLLSGWLLAQRIELPDELANDAEIP